jgi:hypothetical protein
MTADAVLPYDEPPTSIHAAIAAMTAWIADEPALGTEIAAGAVDRDPTGFLGAIAGLVVVVADVAEELEVDVTAILRDVAIGVALAEAEDAP